MMTEKYMKPFMDRSTATSLEKARRVLSSLADGDNYFFFDGFPRHDELRQDALATLDVLNRLAARAHAAPDMYEALKRIVAVEDGVFAAPAPAYNPAREYAEAMADARAALKKAVPDA